MRYFSRGLRFGAAMRPAWCTVVGLLFATAILCGAIWCSRADAEEAWSHYGVDAARVAQVGLTAAEDFGYSEYGDGACVVYGYWGASSVVVVPPRIEGRDVTFVDADAFQGNAALAEVYLPDTVTTMVEGAFEGCTSLRRVNLGGIQYDPSRRNFQWILHGCTSLERLTMSDRASFSITLNGGAGDNLNIMEQDVLDGIKCIYLGASMSDVPVNLFYGKSLQRADVGAGNKSYSSVDGVVYSADGKRLMVMGTGYQGGYAVADGCTSIGDFAFQDCVGLRVLRVPAGVTAFGRKAFDGASPTLVVAKGSAADEYAALNGLKVVYDGAFKKGWTNLGRGAKGYARRGSLVVGWLTLDGSKYWFDAGGVAASGWTEVDGATYYFREDGTYRMAAGWATIDGSKVLFRADGRLADGWVTLNDAQYYSDAGAPRSGWQTIDGTRYYFREGGDYRMAAGFATVGGQKLLFRTDGRLAEGWVTLNGYKYYADAGVPRTGRQKIDGKEYDFYSDGRLKV